MNHFISEPVYKSVIDFLIIGKNVDWYPSYAQKLYALKLSDDLENPEHDAIAAFYVDGNITYYWRNKILRAESISHKRIESVEYSVYSESNGKGRNIDLHRKMFFMGCRLTNYVNEIGLINEVHSIIFCYESRKPSEDKIIEGILDKPKKSDLRIPFKPQYHQYGSRYRK